jgi:hypothetical protein
MTDHLLRPSLGNTSSASAALYSPRSSFLLGFFLGPLPLILYSMLNSIRVKRVRDVAAYALALAAFGALIHATFMQPRPDALLWLNRQLGEGASMRGAMRVLAVLLWCGFYVLHRKEHRANALFGQTPSPWIAAVACGVAGVGLMYVISFLASGELPP